MTHYYCMEDRVIRPEDKLRGGTYSKANVGDHLYMLQSADGKTIVLDGDTLFRKMKNMDIEVVNLKEKAGRVVYKEDDEQDQFIRYITDKLREQQFLRLSISFGQGDSLAGNTPEEVEMLKSFVSTHRINISYPEDLMDALNSMIRGIDPNLLQATIYHQKSECYMIWGYSDVMVDKVIEDIRNCYTSIFNDPDDKVTISKDSVVKGGYRHQVAPAYEAFEIDLDNRLEMLDFINEVMNTKTIVIRGYCWWGRTGEKFIRVHANQQFKDHIQNELEASWNLESAVQKLTKNQLVLGSLGIKETDPLKTMMSLRAMTKQYKVVNLNFCDMHGSIDMKIRPEDTETRMYYTIVNHILSLVDKKSEDIDFKNNRFIIKPYDIQAWFDGGAVKVSGL